MCQQTTKRHSYRINLNFCCTVVTYPCLYMSHVCIELISILISILSYRLKPVTICYDARPAGESMEAALRTCCKGIKIGKILVVRHHGQPISGPTSGMNTPVSCFSPLMRAPSQTQQQQQVAGSGGGGSVVSPRAAAAHNSSSSRAGSFGLPPQGSPRGTVALNPSPGVCSPVALIRQTLCMLAHTVQEAPVIDTAGDQHPTSWQAYDVRLCSVTVAVLQHEVGA
jgi:hypothetical protein